MIALKEHPAPPRSFQHRPLRAQLSGRVNSLPGLNAAEPPETETASRGKFTRILVPTDFSSCSAKAVAQAAALARRDDATLTILHVIDVNPPAALIHCGTAEDLMRQLWATGTFRLNCLAESLARDRVKVRTLIIEGLPAEAIVENSSAFDVLVVGEPRSKSAWRLFRTHTARRAIEQAQCPVLVVPEKPGTIGRKLASKVNLAV